MKHFKFLSKILIISSLAITSCYSMEKTTSVKSIINKSTDKKQLAKLLIKWKNKGEVNITDVITCVHHDKVTLPAKKILNLITGNENTDKAINSKEFAELISKITKDEKISESDLLKCINILEAAKLATNDQDFLEDLKTELLKRSSNKKEINTILSILAPEVEKSKKSINKTLKYLPYHPEASSIITQFKSAILSAGSIFTLWLSGHAICHPCMEAFEVQSSIPGIALTVISGYGLYKLYNLLKTAKQDDESSVQDKLINWAAGKYIFNNPN